MARGNRKPTGKTNKAGDKRGTTEGSGLTQFKEGESGNPNGRKKGQRNFATIYREALIKVGTTKGIEPDDLELALVVKALEKALKGDFKFYQDVQDRIHGKPVQTNLNKSIDDTELDEDEIETLDAMLAKFVKKKPATKKPKATKKVATAA